MQKYQNKPDTNPQLLIKFMELTSQNQLPVRFEQISKNADIFMGFGVMAILMVMLIPIPALFLDLFLTLNITVAISILMLGMYILKPLELSAFPSILLLVTLFRLSLNVASTRMILLHGDQGTQAAGKVIQAFGSFVVGGNYVVGVIVFTILVVINFMVITKGAGRIAEVAARFTLDAMPGKQMSIDADLNAGLIDEQEARERRRLISKESEYYGAMDGANKFVRGDAIAGIIITLINIFAGFAIGVFQNGMSFSEAAQTYTLLTVGDGLVSQIPALIISTAAGIMVTRAGTDNSLGHEISAQIFVQPRALGVTALILFLFGIIPGLPTVPFLILGTLVGLAAFFLFQSGKLREQEIRKAAELESVEEQQTPEAIKPLPPVDILSLEIGYGLIKLVDHEQDGQLLDRIKSIRRQFTKELGIIVPSIHIQDNMQLKPGEYLIRLKGIEIARGNLMVNYLLAMNPGNSGDKIDGIATREPTYGLEAYWIKEEKRELAMAKGYTVVDVATVLTTHLSDVIRHYAPDLLGRQEVQKLTDHLKETHPKVVEELIPNQLSLGNVVKVLQNLLSEQIPIRDLLTIIETLADWSPSVKQIDTLTEYVRQALSRTIYSLYQSNGEIAALTLDQQVEQSFADALQQSDHGSYFAMEPRLAQKIMNDIAAKLEKFANINLQPIILCSAVIRPHFKKLVDRFIPNIVILSYEEIANSAKINNIGIVELPDAD
jgi:flagellar biosynthesis protein FlhA